eukprot:5975398-Pyramimonas_sp.AAC.1
MRGSVPGRASDALQESFRRLARNAFRCELLLALRSLVATKYLVELFVIDELRGIPARGGA